MALSGFVGNEHALTLLRRLTEKDALPHAWLFAGPAKVGKRTLAVEWAKFLNCQSPVQTPAGMDACDLCPSCRHLEPNRPSYAQTHPSVRLVDTLLAAYWEATERVRDEEVVDPTKLKPKLSLGIKAVRALREEVVSTSLWRWRVFIIDEGERLTEEASAALLKTLEEPPERTLFILVSANPWAIHPTVRSRCHLLRFRLVPSAQIVAALRHRGVEEKEAQKLARLSRGRIGWALNAAGDPTWQTALEQLKQRLHAAWKMNLWDIFRFAEQCAKGIEESGEEETTMAQQRRALEELLEGLMLGYRDLLTAAWQATDLTVNPSWLSQRQELAAWTPDRIVAALQSLQRTWRYIRPPLNANPQLALEVLAASFANDV